MSGRLINRGERLTAIERMLVRNNQGLRAVEIAQLCDVDRRTIYRDLETLEELGVPITQHEGRFFINRDYYLASVRLNFHEAVALYLSARTYARSAEQQNPYLIAALTKLSASLPEPLAGHVGYIADWARGNPIDRNFASTLEMLTRGWVERRKIKVWGGLGHGGEVNGRDFSVYFIEPTTSGALYAIGYDDYSLSVAAVKVNAIRRAKLLDATYEIPAQFDRRPYLDSIWGVLTSEGGPRTRVVIAFSPEVTPLMRERLWHASQQIETLNDKRCTLTVYVSDWHDLLPWIRSWGAQVEVLEPAALRHELAAEALKMATVYTALSY
jgi:predicted DNA-binding transcriptional regulator YafY